MPNPPSSASHATDPAPWGAMTDPITEDRVRSVVDRWYSEASIVRRGLAAHTATTEGHLVYAWGVAMGVTAALAGHSLRGRGVFPGSGVVGNLWVLLVGPQGRSRKTTSLQIAYDLAYEVAPERLIDRPGSVEALLEALEEAPARCLYLPELGDYLAVVKKGRLAGANELLVKLFDGKSEKIRYVRRTITLHEPRLSLLGGVTPAYLAAHTTPQDWRGGFFSRMLVLAACPERRVRLRGRDPTLERAHYAATAAVARLGGGMGSLHPDPMPSPAGFTPEAEALWLSWHDEIDARTARWTHHEALAGILSRASLQTAKLCLLNSAIDAAATGTRAYGEGWRIGLPHLAPAVALVDLHLRSAVESACLTHESPDARDKAAVLRALSAAPAPITVGEVCKQTGLLLNRVYAILDTLRHQGDAQLHPNGKWSAARPIPISGAGDLAFLL